MGFICNQDNFLVLKILNGYAILFGVVQVNVQLLNGCKIDVDVFRVSFFKVFNFFDKYLSAVNHQFVVEQVFTGLWIQEIVFGFLDDVVAVHKKQKVTIPLFIEVKHQARHYQGLTTACCHIKK